MTSQMHENSFLEDDSSVSPEFSSAWLWPLVSISTIWQASVFSWHCSPLEQPQIPARGCATKLPWCRLLLSSTTCPLISLIPRTHFVPHDLFNHLHKKSTHLIYFYEGWFWCDLGWVNTFIHVSYSPRQPGFILSRTHFNDLLLETQYGAPSLACMDREMLRSLLFWVPQEDTAPF